MRSGTVWTFKPRGSRFVTRLRLERMHGYRYDGDDEGGETQAALDSGEYVAFGAIAEVLLDGEVIGTDSLWGCVYSAETVSDFWTAHRDSDWRNRNCTLYRAKNGENACVCHYFPDLIGEAISEARQHVRDMPIPPRIREGAR